MTTVARLQNNKRSLRFAGGSTHQVRMNAYDPTGTTGWTIEHWIRWTGAATASGITFCQEDFIEAQVSSGKFQYAWSPFWSWVGNVPVETGVWTHFAITYDKAKQKIYKNGVLVYERAQTGDMVINTNFFKIGARGVSATTAASPFTGNIRDFRVWNVARTQEEIMHNMNGIGGKELGLIGWYPLGEGTGSVAKDNSATAKDGTVTGAVWEEEYDPNVNFLNKKELRESLTFLTRAKKYPEDGQVPYAGVYDADENLVYRYGRAWHISVWSIAEKRWLSHDRYDTYDATNRATNQTAFVNKITSIPAGELVCIAGSHAPEHLSVEMETAIKSCGGSSGKLGWRTRRSYICVGQKGIGEGNAILEELDNISTSPAWAEGVFETERDYWNSFSMDTKGNLTSVEIIEDPRPRNDLTSPYLYPSRDGSMQSCTIGKWVGDPTQTNGVNNRAIDGGWRYSMHYCPIEDYGEVLTTLKGIDGPKIFRQFDTKGDWKAFTGMDYTYRMNKWYRTSVYARAPEGGRAAMAYMPHNGSNTGGIRKEGNWSAAELASGQWVRKYHIFQATADASGGFYLYGYHGRGLIDYAGVMIEEFDAQPTGPPPPLEPGQYFGNDGKVYIIGGEFIEGVEM